MAHRAGCVGPQFRGELKASAKRLAFIRRVRRNSRDESLLVKNCTGKQHEQEPAHIDRIGASQNESVARSESCDNTENMSQEAESLGVAMALAVLGWYRSFISPLLPNTCRFLPSCSLYSMEAYKEYGVLRGSILTAWRLVRCSPLNVRLKYQGKYDPPTWPPVGLESFFR